jgi:hypothetical protein
MTTATPKPTKLSNLKVADIVELQGLTGIIQSIIANNSTSKYLNLLLKSGDLRQIVAKETDEIFKKRKDSDLAYEFDKACLMSMKTLRWNGGNLGSDPEMFVFDSVTKQVIPAFKFLDKNGGKDKTDDGNKLFWDGFQAEFNITSGSCLDERVNSTRFGLRALNKKAKAFNPNAILTVQTTVDIPSEMFADAKPEHIAFGCTPSKNVYGMDGIKMDGKDVPFRSAGGHIHYGLDKKEWNIPDYVKALDKILGVACVALFAKYDNPSRRTMYGLAGEYRTPPHGLEYRTLSNVWLSHPTIMYIVYELSRKAIAMEQKGLMRFWDSSEKETIACINNCDVDKAKAILKRNDKVFKDLIKSFSYNDNNSKVIWNMFMSGVDSLVNTETIEENWHLNSDLFDYHNVRIVTMNEKLAKYDELLGQDL